MNLAQHESMFFGKLMWSLQIIAIGLFFVRLKAEVTRKYGLSSQPRLVDIISAVPVTHKKTLLPKLKVHATNVLWCDKGK